MKSVGRQAKATQGSFAGLKSSVVGLAAGFFSVGAAISALHKVWSLLTDAFREMDEIAKLSDRTGVAIDMLVGLQHAAAQTGTTTEMVTKAIQRQNKVLGEAAAGYTANAKLLRGLGLDLQRLAAMDPGQAFMEIAEQISRIESPMRRAAIAQQIYGRSGQEMMNLLMKGKAGLIEYIDEAERLGLTFSREEAAKIEEYNDAMDKLHKTVQGLFREIGPETSEALLAFAEAITPLMRELSGIVAYLAENMERTKSAALAHPFLALIGLVGGAFEEEEQAAENVGTAHKKAASAAEDAQQRMQDASKKTTEQLKEQAAAAEDAAKQPEVRSEDAPRGQAGGTMTNKQIRERLGTDAIGMRTRTYGERRDEEVARKQAEEQRKTNKLLFEQLQEQKQTNDALADAIGTGDEIEVVVNRL